MRFGILFLASSIRGKRDGISERGGNNSFDVCERRKNEAYKASPVASKRCMRYPFYSGTHVMEERTCMIDREAGNFWISGAWIFNHVRMSCMHGYVLIYCKDVQTHMPI